MLTRGQGHALRMIAGGKGDHTFGTCFIGQGGYRRKSTAIFKTTRVLQAFGFYKNPLSRNVIKERRGQKGRHTFMAHQAIIGGANAVIVHLSSP